MRFFVAALFIGAACTAPAPNPSASAPAATVSPTPASAVPGLSRAQATRSITVPWLASVGAVDGGLVAATQMEQQWPSRHEILVADAAGDGGWRRVRQVSSSVRLTSLSLHARRLAITSVDEGTASPAIEVSLIELTSGDAIVVDRSTISSAAWRGIGGSLESAPQLWPRVVLRDEFVAWSLPVERTDGSVAVELRIKRIDGGAPRAVAASQHGLEPAAIDGGRLAYRWSSGSVQEARLYDIATGSSRVVARAAHVGEVALVGPWYLFISGDEFRPRQVRIKDLRSGVDRILETAGSDTGPTGSLPGGCGNLTANDIYAAWVCSEGSGLGLDLRTQQRVALGGAAAYAGALVWEKMDAERRLFILELSR